MRHMIKHCAQLHMHQIANGGDPFESGSARPLDFGHWAAHRLETISNYQLRHGEAVAIGIAIDSRYSVLSGLLPKGDDERIYCLLTSLGFDLWHDCLEKKSANDEWEIMQGLSQFQEHLGGELTITLLKELGVGVEVHEMDQTYVKQAIQWIKEKSKSQPKPITQR